MYQTSDHGKKGILSNPLLMAGILSLMVILWTGCEEAYYKGATMSQKIEKVVLFDIEGAGRGGVYPAIGNGDQQSEPGGSLRQ